MYKRQELDTEQSIRVVAGYIDGDGFNESVVSEAITIAALVNEGQASFEISGIAETGQRLQVYQSGDDPDGNSTIAINDPDGSALLMAPTGAMLAADLPIS